MKTLTLLIASLLFTPSFAADSDQRPAAPQDQSASSLSNSASYGQCILDEASIEAFRKQRDELALKEKQLAEKGNELSARETAVAEELKKLQAIKAEIAGMTAQQASEKEAQVQRVVEALEKMSPKAAAPMLTKMEEELVAIALERVTALKMAKILSAMDAEKSAKIATRLALGERGVKPANTNGAKGGQGDAKSDGNRNPASKR